MFDKCESEPFHKGFEARIPPYFRSIERKLIWELLPRFAVDARFIVTKDQIRIQAPSPDWKVFIEITLFRDFFRSLTGSSIFSTLSLSKRSIPPSKLRRDCEEVIWFDSELRFLRIAKYQRRVQNFGVLKGQLLTYPTVYNHLNGGVNLSIPTKDLLQIFEDMKTPYFKDFVVAIDCVPFQRKINFSCKYESNKKVIGSYQVDWFPTGTSYLSFPEKGPLRSEYGWRDIYTFLEGVSSELPEVKLKYNANCPLEISGKIGKGIELVAITAAFCEVTPTTLFDPRVEKLQPSLVNSLCRHFQEDTRIWLPT